MYAIYKQALTFCVLQYLEDSFGFSSCILFNFKYETKDVFCEIMSPKLSDMNEVCADGYVNAMYIILKCLLSLISAPNHCKHLPL